MDGQPSLWEDRRTYLPMNHVVEILDLLHVTPRLWEAAYLFHPEGSDETVAFVRERLLGILRGQAGYVIGGLRQMGTKHSRFHLYVVHLFGSRPRRYQQDPVSAQRQDHPYDVFRPLAPQLRCTVHSRRL